jgi:hypothetical protein
LCNAAAMLLDHAFNAACTSDVASGASEWLGAPHAGIIPWVQARPYVRVAGNQIGGVAGWLLVVDPTGQPHVVVRKECVGTEGMALPRTHPMALGAFVVRGALHREPFLLLHMGACEPQQCAGCTWLVL